MSVTQVNGVYVIRVVHIGIEICGKMVQLAERWSGEVLYHNGVLCGEGQYASGAVVGK